jgi:Gram-negative bacterial TonB protein C-terminal
MGSMVFKGLLLFFALSFLTVGCSQKVYTVVDVQPEYPNGRRALYDYLNKNIHFIRDCTYFISGRGGSINICFIIEKDGSVTKNDCNKRHQCEEFEISLANIIQLMPKWKPALIKGKPVRVQYTLPIKIRLE